MLDKGYHVCDIKQEVDFLLECYTLMSFYVYYLIDRVTLTEHGVMVMVNNGTLEIRKQEIFGIFLGIPF